MNKALFSDWKIKQSTKKGLKFLEDENQNGFYPSYISNLYNKTSTKQATREIFSSIIISDNLINIKKNKLFIPSLQYIENQSKKGLLTFFEDQNLIIPDSDTNSLGYSILLENARININDANKILDKILEYSNNNNIIQVWLSNNKTNRLDHVVATNVVYFAYLLNRENEIKKTEDWLIKILDSNKYLNGSRYYHSPDSFLYFLGRLMRFPKITNKLKTKLKKHLQQRIRKTEYSLDLAMRIILSNSLGIENEQEKHKLLELQELSGSWPTDALYRLGTKPIFYNNKSIPTIFAIKALDYYNQ